MLIGYGRFGLDQYAGGFWSFRRSTDPAGTLAVVDQIVQDGKAPYNKTFAGPNNRWGDFSATSVDPSDGVTMWTIQEYAETPSGANDRWGTWWTSVNPSAANQQLITISSNVPGLSFTLDGSATHYAPAPFLFTAGSNHTVQWNTPQSGPAVTHHVFTAWHDGPTSNPPIITTPAATTTFPGNVNTPYHITKIAGRGRTR